MTTDDPIRQLERRISISGEESRHLLRPALLLPPAVAVLTAPFAPVLQASNELLADEDAEALPAKSLLGILGNPAERDGAGLVQVTAIIVAVLAIGVFAALACSALATTAAAVRGASILAQIGSIVLVLAAPFLAAVLANPQEGTIGGLGYTMGAGWIPAMAIFIWSAWASHQARDLVT